MNELPEEVYLEPLGLPFRWQSDEKLKAAVQAHFSQRTMITQEYLEMIRAYCLYVVKAPCYYESQAEEERQVLEDRIGGVKTIEALEGWLEDARRFGIDPFDN